MVAQLTHYVHARECPIAARRLKPVPRTPLIVWGQDTVEGESVLVGVLRARAFVTIACGLLALAFLTTARVRSM
jgi:hypothetical protein